MKNKTFYKVFITVFVLLAVNYTASAQSSATKQNDASLQSKEQIKKLDYYKSTDQSGLKYQTQKMNANPVYSNFRINGQAVKVQPKPYNAAPISREAQLKQLRQKAIESGVSTEKYDVELNKLTNQN